jgi:hypothetical protein
MTPMHLTPRRSRRAAPLAAAGIALFTLLCAAPAEAQSRKKKQETYIFLPTKVDLVKGLPASIEAPIRRQLTRAIEEHADLEIRIADGAPDPDKEAKKFVAFLKRRNQRCYKVNVEVTEYSMEVEDLEGGRGKRVAVRVSLRLFGEAVPQRVMAFAGDGSATVKMDVGKTVRDRDRQVANDEAMQLAVADAIEASINKLREPPPSKRFPGKRK